MGRDRNDEGRYNDRIPAGEVLTVFDGRDDPARPLTAGDIVDALGIARRTAHKKLNILVERGELDTRKVGARGRVWWVPQDTPESGRDRRDRAAEDTADRSDTSEPTTGESDSTPPEGIVEAVDRVGEEWDDTPDRLEARKRAARAVLEYAAEHGTVSKQEAKEEVYPDHPVEGQNPRTWYRKNVRPVLNEVAEYDQSARAYTLCI